MDILDNAHLARSHDYDAVAPLLSEEEAATDMVPPSRLRRSSRRHYTEPHLNITSFVDVLSVLLFFLLSVATLERLGAHEVSLPQQTQDFTKESTLEVKNLALSLSKNALTLRGLITPEGREPQALKVEVPVADGYYDLPRLRAELLKIKQAYKTDGAIILMVADDVNFDSVVKVMDTAREQVEFVGGQRKITTLFPDISLSDYLLEREA